MLIALGAAGYALSQRMQKHGTQRNAAFADDQAQGDATTVRDAGPEAMRDPSARGWSQVDQASDESFPASDPPGNY